MDGRLGLSLGFRMDANSYSPEMSNLLDQFSPRFSASWAFSEKWSFNFNTGIFYQLPSYTTMGFRSAGGEAVNRQNGLTYMRSGHLVAGLEYQPGEESKITVEGFYKHYSNYPFSVNDSVPLSTKAADFGTFGSEEVFSAAEGRAYGLELLYRNRDLFGFNVILSYTLVNSEFRKQDASLEFTGGYLPTAWDNKHLLNLTATRSFKRNWDIGFKWRLVGGAPYTPYDVERSSLLQAWDATGMPYLDYSRFNSLRLEPFHQLDLRIDKEYYFDKWSLRFYVDVQNVYNFKSDEPGKLINENENGEEVILNPADPPEEQRYLLRTIRSDGQGTVLPTIGVIVEF